MSPNLRIKKGKLCKHYNLDEGWYGRVAILHPGPGTKELCRKFASLPSLFTLELRQIPRVETGVSLSTVKRT